MQRDAKDQNANMCLQFRQELMLQWFQKTYVDTKSLDVLMFKKKYNAPLTISLQKKKNLNEQEQNKTLP